MARLEDDDVYWGVDEGGVWINVVAPYATLEITPEELVRLLGEWNVCMERAEALEDESN